MIAGLLKFKNELLRSDNRIYLMYLTFIRFRGDKPFTSFAEVNDYLGRFVSRFEEFDERYLINYFDSYLENNSYLENFGVKDRPWF